jgi:hypothetical protein
MQRQEFCVGALWQLSYDAIGARMMGETNGLSVLMDVIAHCTTPRHDRIRQWAIAAVFTATDKLPLNRIIAINCNAKNPGNGLLDVLLRVCLEGEQGADERAPAREVWNTPGRKHPPVPGSTVLSASVRFMSLQLLTKLCKDDYVKRTDATAAAHVARMVKTRGVYSLEFACLLTLQSDILPAAQEYAACALARLSVQFEVKRSVQQLGGLDVVMAVVRRYWDKLRVVEVQFERYEHATQEVRAAEGAVEEERREREAGGGQKQRKKKQRQSQSQNQGGEKETVEKTLSRVQAALASIRKITSEEVRLHRGVLTRSLHCMLNLSTLHNNQHQITKLGMQLLLDIARSVKDRQTQAEIAVAMGIGATFGGTAGTGNATTGTAGATSYSTGNITTVTPLAGVGSGDGDNDNGSEQAGKPALGGGGSSSGGAGFSAMVAAFDTGGGGGAKLAGVMKEAGGASGGGDGDTEEEGGLASKLKVPSKWNKLKEEAHGGEIIDGYADVDVRYLRDTGDKEAATEYVLIAQELLSNIMRHPATATYFYKMELKLKTDDAWRKLLQQRVLAQSLEAHIPADQALTASFTAPDMLGFSAQTPPKALAPLQVFPRDGVQQDVLLHGTAGGGAHDHDSSSTSRWSGKPTKEMEGLLHNSGGRDCSSGGGGGYDPIRGSSASSSRWNPRYARPKEHTGLKLQQRRDLIGSEDAKLRIMVTDRVHLRPHSSQSALSLTQSLGLNMGSSVSMSKNMRVLGNQRRQSDISCSSKAPPSSSRRRKAAGARVERGNAVVLPDLKSPMRANMKATWKKQVTRRQRMQLMAAQNRSNSSTNKSSSLGFSGGGCGGCGTEGSGNSMNWTDGSVVEGDFTLPSSTAGGDGGCMGGGGMGRGGLSSSVATLGFGLSQSSGIATTGSGQPWRPEMQRLLLAQYHDAHESSDLAKDEYFKPVRLYYWKDAHFDMWGGTTATGTVASASASATNKMGGDTSMGVSMGMTCTGMGMGTGKPLREVRELATEFPPFKVYKKNKKSRSKDVAGFTESTGKDAAAEAAAAATTGDAGGKGSKGSKQEQNKGDKKSQGGKQAAKGKDSIIYVASSVDDVDAVGGSIDSAACDEGGASKQQLEKQFPCLPALDPVDTILQSGSKLDELSLYFQDHDPNLDTYNERKAERASKSTAGKGGSNGNSNGNNNGNSNANGNSNGNGNGNGSGGRGRRKKSLKKSKSNPAFSACHVYCTNRLSERIEDITLERAPQEPWNPPTLTSPWGGLHAALPTVPEPGPPKDSDPPRPHTPARPSANLPDKKVVPGPTWGVLPDQNMLFVVITLGSVMPPTLAPDSGDVQIETKVTMTCDTDDAVLLFAVNSPKGPSVNPKDAIEVDFSDDARNPFHPSSKGKTFRYDPVSTLELCVCGEFTIHAVGTRPDMKPSVVVNEVYHVKPKHQVKKLWTLLDSIWVPRTRESESRDFFDSAKVHKKTFELDWKRCVQKTSFQKFLARYVGEGPEGEREILEIKEEVWEDYDVITHAFDFYAACSKGHGFGVKLNAYSEFLDDCFIPDGASGSCTRNILDSIFVATNVVGGLVD